MYLSMVKEFLNRQDFKDFTVDVYSGKDLVNGDGSEDMYDTTNYNDVVFCQQGETTDPI